MLLNAWAIPNRCSTTFMASIPRRCGRCWSACKPGRHCSGDQMMCLIHVDASEANGPRPIAASAAAWAGAANVLVSLRGSALRRNYATLIRTYEFHSAEHPAFASRVAASLRSPWAEQCGSVAPGGGSRQNRRINPTQRRVGASAQYPAGEPQERFRRSQLACSPASFRNGLSRVAPVLEGVLIALRSPWGRPSVHPAPAVRHCWGPARLPASGPRSATGAEVYGRLGWHWIPLSSIMRGSVRPCPRSPGCRNERGRVPP